MPSEQCEYCGQFGAKRGTYADTLNPISKTMTLYLCPPCDTVQREFDAERTEKAWREIAAHTALMKEVN